METVKDRSIFAEFLLDSRLEKGWSLRDLEIATEGISPSYLHRLEKGLKKNPSVLTLNALAKAYEVDLIDLIELVLRDQKERNDE
ncbi:helix-turn-helix domain-containing protein [Bacillus sp. HMF5848]|uniref:helix-turn-helix domain-containing protein n=1 Tax=Bacillus sp. HMF5848 TaxID=2495421 RepID=UPI001639FF6E|nr:helix-turn-helix transcriptional regulator [Bacillus sp. HMF5848]